VVSRTQTKSEELERTIWAALSQVHDPEIPPCSITDLGIVERVGVTEDSVDVDLLPTFAGCPALDVIRDDVEMATRQAAQGRGIRVRFVYSKPWTSDRITAEGRRALREYGLTPPGEKDRAEAVVIPLAALGRRSGTAVCPFCGSSETVMESAFGPTLCRSTHFCRSCRNPFEAFKPKTLT
jgi:ring-1,2-phenylacetyl-CoA epoxidase subunit PaaD